MDAKSYTYTRKNLAKMMKQICEDHDTVIVTRKNEEPVVMMSLKDYNAYAETAYLLKSPANAERLLQSMKDAKEGKYTFHDIIEVEEQDKEYQEEAQKKETGCA